MGVFAREEEDEEGQEGKWEAHTRHGGCWERLNHWGRICQIFITILRREMEYAGFSKVHES